MAKENLLGVFQKGNKTAFSVFSEHAEKVELCLFSDDEKTETRVEMKRGEDNISTAELDEDRKSVV